MATRNAASVLPDPVGAEMSVVSPRRMAGQPLLLRFGGGAEFTEEPTRPRRDAPRRGRARVASLGTDRAAVLVGRRRPCGIVARNFRYLFAATGGVDSAVFVAAWSLLARQSRQRQPPARGSGTGGIEVGEIRAPAAPFGVAAGERRATLRAESLHRCATTFCRCRCRLLLLRDFRGRGRRRWRRRVCPARRG